MIKTFLRWLISKLGEANILVIPIGVIEILDSVGNKIDEVEELQTITSEGKRSMVYGSLIKRHPDTSRRHIGMAIEIVLNGRK